MPGGGRRLSDGGRGPHGEGLSPETQRLLGYLVVGGLALMAVVRVLRALFFSMPIMAVLLVITKPSLEGFPEFLSILEKKRDQQEAQQRSNSDGGWLLNLVAKGIHKGVEILGSPPHHSWLYLDLGLLVVAKRKTLSSQATKKYALG